MIIVLASKVFDHVDTAMRIIDLLFVISTSSIAFANATERPKPNMYPQEENGSPAELFAGKSLQEPDGQSSHSPM